MKIIDYIVYILVIIGALNWGLVGFFNFNLVSFVFGDMAIVTHIIYGVVGLAGLYMIFSLARVRRSK